MIFDKLPMIFDKFPMMLYHVGVILESILGQFGVISSHVGLMLEHFWRHLGVIWWGDCQRGLPCGGRGGLCPSRYGNPAAGRR